MITYVTLSLNTGDFQVTLGLEESFLQQQSFKLAKNNSWKNI